MADPALPHDVTLVPADELPDTSLFWRWVGRAVRPYVGWILVGLGALAVLAGYLGVSRQALVAKQLPYLISGGITGLALIALGTFYLMTEELRRDSGRLDRLERMMMELHAVLLSRSDAPDSEAVDQAVRVLAGTPGSAANGRTGGEGRVLMVALPDSERYHRSDCRMVNNKDGVEEVSAQVIRRRQLQPCAMCEPTAELVEHRA
jgi:hypothetical protein